MLTASEQAALAFFPKDYADARERFLTLARACGARLTAYPIGARGPAGEALYVDTAYLGAARPRRLFVVLSGTHGVEGFAGSALQQRWLHGSDPKQIPDGAGVLLVHALNPYGFAWRRRANEHNVDLNRNALERFPGPRSAAYRRLDAWLNPPAPPDFFDVSMLKGAGLLLRHGFAPLQQAIVEGQYEFPRGLFYGGDGIEASTAILFRILDDEAWRDLAAAVLIDVHTGVGRFATYKLMVDYAEPSAAYRLLTQWFGAEAVASNRPHGSLAYRVHGGLTEAIARRWGAGRAHTAVLEFGTRPARRVLAALRRENRAYHYSPSGSVARVRAHDELQEIFCPRDTSWRLRVLAQGEQVLRQAQAACFSSADAADALRHTPRE